jgi:peptidoglycan lytic transglycosylase B
MKAALRTVRMVAVTFVALGALSCASAQQTGTVGTQAKSEWSGQSGASGHPLMTAEAIRAAAADFPNCLDRMWPDAASRGVSRENFINHTAALMPDLRIMDFLDAQPEFVRPLWDYLDGLVSDQRVQMGQEVLAKHRAVFDQVERAYGVDRHIITAIWGVESRFGDMIGDRPVLRSTATLACVGRRQAFFRDEFLATLEILHHGDVRPEQLKGSWAGAFGPTQFMPTSFKRYAVDFDGDGRRDVVDSIPDLIASTANNLKKDGWLTGQPWGYEVVLPAGFDYLLADRARQVTIGEWEKLGVRRPAGKPFANRDERAFLLLPAGAQGPAFLMLPNFQVLMKYNPAEAYALAIGHLADRMRGEPPIAQAWPRHEPVLTRDERRELQKLLLSRGFDLGEPDGRLGPRSRVAIREFQLASGLIPDGFASADILGRLRNR